MRFLLATDLKNAMFLLLLVLSVQQLCQMQGAQQPETLVKADF